MALRRSSRLLVPSLLVLSLVLLVGPPATSRSPRRAAGGQDRSVAPAATAGWPVSSDVVVGEVVTGGTSASDEWVELYGRGPLAADLGALELLYVTATGSTVTRKATFPGRILAPGERLLLANAAGAWAGIADATWTGGLAATGGTIALRVIGGSVVDSLSWGAAANPFVEGTPGAAPATGSSLERQPVGPTGNGRDTNDNAVDAWVQPMPLPEGAPAVPTTTPTPVPTPVATDPPSTPGPTLTSPPTAPPSASPQPTTTPAPSATPAATEAPATSATPTPMATPQATVDPSASSDPTATPGTTPAASAPPMPTPAPTTTPIVSAPPVPTPTPSPAATVAPPAVTIATIGAARTLPLDTPVTVEGVLTTPLGLTEAGKGAFLEDASGGIALYLSAGDWAPVPAGARVRVAGITAERYGQRTIRITAAADVIALVPDAAPPPAELTAGTDLEALEGRLITVTGHVAGAADSLSDGYAVDLARPDASTLRVVVAGAAAVDPALLWSGASVRITGVLGQRDASGAGTSGYRVHVRTATDVIPEPAPTPRPSDAAPSGTPAPTPGVTLAPTATPSSQPTPAATPTLMPTPTPTPTAAPTATPAPTAIADGTIPILTARQQPTGSRVIVSGTVTTEAGRLLDERVIVIQDAGGGIPVRLPSGVERDRFTRGRVVRITGVLAAPYANQEVRPAKAADVTILGGSAVPAPIDRLGSELGETTEGTLARIAGTIERVDGGSSGSITVIAEDASGTIRVFLHAGVGANRERLKVGSRLTAIGVVGQRESASGSGDGHRLWPRDAQDLVMSAGPIPTPTPDPTADPDATPRPTTTPRPRPTGTPAPRTRRITDLRSGETAAIDGSVTTAPGLLDGDGRRVVVQDATGAILVRLPEGAAAPRIGTRVRATGEVGTYYDAPQLAVDDPITDAGRKATAPLLLRRAPGREHEWRLVRVVVRITDVRRDGDAWRLEGSLGAAGSLPVAGVAAAGIGSTELEEGRMATITGIVRRAWPTASDQRFAIVPRSPEDLRLGPAPAAEDTPEADGVTDEALGAGGDAGSGAGPGDSPSADRSTGQGGITADGAVVARLADLPALVGRRVRVGATVAAVDGQAIVLRDGTVTGRVRLTDALPAGDAALAAGEVVNVTGTVSRPATGGDPELVAATADLTRAARLALPVLAPDPAGEPADERRTEAAPGAADPVGPGPVPIALVTLALAAATIAVGAALAWRARRRRAEGLA